jgi:hypothetical protein
MDADWLGIYRGWVSLMMGPDANTVDGKFDPNSWNDDIFSIRRIRIAPLFVVIGFAIEVYAILKRK